MALQIASDDTRAIVKAVLPIFEGVDDESAMDAGVNIITRLIYVQARNGGVPLDAACTWADALVEDVKACLRANWGSD